MTTDEILARAEYDSTYPLGMCVLCDRETFACARIPRRDGKFGVETIYLCFREHRNEAGLRQALEGEGGPCTA
jgi:phosphoribosyl-dephospho-CoA transferase